MTTLARHAISFATIAVLVGFAGAAAQEPASSLAVVLERTGRYVEDYEKQFSAVVCEERQKQALVRPDGSVGRQRELRSDFLLVKVGGEATAAFRDVLEVDGKPIRHREDRLRRLFLESPRTAVEQAKAILKESVRYNIGVSRAIVSPLVPLHILVPRIASGFRFAGSGATLTFEEFRSPTVFTHHKGSRIDDMFSRGSVVFDPESGRVLSLQVTAGNASSDFQATLGVRYVEDAGVTLLVPVEMTERYWRPAKPREEHLEVSSTYSNFRRFQVRTEEQIKVPK